MTGSLILTAEKYELCCEMDKSETESPEESEKDTKEKDVLKEGKLTDISKFIIDLVQPNISDRYKQNWYFTAYLEVCSPPPELV
jgi:hypothetical protein